MTDTNRPSDTFSTTNFAIIVAGGNGSRMKSDIPKQFLLLKGKPILQHTIEQFLAVDLPLFTDSQIVDPVSEKIGIILVLPERERAIWDKLCNENNFHPAIQIVAGGTTRFQSVRNGLNAIAAPAGIVAVHDGVRPFVLPEIIRNSFETAARTGSAVTCVPVKDSVRVVGADGVSQAVDRSQYRLVQTPQTFRLDLFRQAFQTQEQAFFTDCASVMEYAGFPITLIDGAYENIKITTPEDLR
ncbi:2-C-methyl-D-erythritol 4-phosphate cytidylyltransferase [Spirosoma radiotolerans]|uniref:2-C-methyl-D-erythritol 4-phosphate cytidylyltransferase n=1 Tax=Spirosoma radiotolerans TaxID=1379870 RepID=A0A0E3ZT55_9BACT|nr:2-C-methyl-D-erythritol 4-phosphate cytidylyltransferase [Spirosoma radiotolerans]AKD54730.1 2-C-methyl-D-erythritol 4-phosphate cytidylyltransferase [Spirosoma radiotolerans]